MARQTSRNCPVFAAVIFCCLSGWLFPQAQTQVGYTTITADSGSLLPVGAAVFSYSNADGLLVSQAGVGACDPLTAGRIFVDESGPQTGIAFANVSAQAARITLVLRNSSGGEISRKSIDIAAGRHTATFIFQEFQGLPGGFTGSLSFESTQRVAAITLRQSQNRRGEPLYTTLPVADLSAAASQAALVFPQIAAGDGYSTQLILVNTGSQAISGKIRFRTSSGSPLTLRLGADLNSEFSYRLDANGTFKADLDRLSGLGVGYAVVSPDAGMVSPAGSAVFQYKAGGFIITEAGVGASPATTKARIFVDNVGTYTGVALANTAGQTVEANFTLLDPAGFTLQTVARTIPASGHLAIFTHELFPGLPATFAGLMEIRSPSELNPITLKLTINKKDEQILTTLPVADLNKPPAVSSAVFPQIAIGGGFSTRLIFISASTTSIMSGRMAFFKSDATPMVLPVGSKTSSQIAYQFIAGGGRQYQPGSTASLSRLLLVDPSSHAQATEVIINEGNSVRVPVLAIDTDGRPRDDFDISCTSLGTDVASVDSFGVAKGKAAGFSTITISSGSVVTTGTITVVKVSAGTAGYEIQGIAQDQARRLYLAATQQHTILLAESLTQAPEIYAGKAQQEGLKNDLRKDSLFRNPSYIAFNQGDATLYVSEIGNHIIRRVKPGASGKVETFAGTGTAGYKDGAAGEAAFNRPRGIAMDGRGYLWVADSGNHLVRRVNLLTGSVETVAGSVGISGTADGTKMSARFNSPAGIAAESETIGAQLEREAKGLPPPPVTVIVADEGSGLIRRVSETGEVKTIGLSGAGAPSSPSSITGAAVFSRPSGVATDASGNIFVAESDAGNVSTIFPDGSIVSAVQPGTLANPQGIASAEGGKLIVAESQRFAREISYGSPRITSITPAEISVRGGEILTVEGANFSKETLVLFRDKICKDRQVLDTQTIIFRASAMPSGLTTLTVQNRGGIAQTSFLITPISFRELPPGYITTVAGGSTYIGDGGPAISAIVMPGRMVFSARGDLFVGEGNRIRKIEAGTGIVTTVAGGGESDPNNVPALGAALNGSSMLATDLAGNLYMTGGGGICKASAATGMVRKIADLTKIGYSGDGGSASSAQFTYPSDMVADSAGNLYIADRGNGRVRKINAATGIITTYAGNNSWGYSGDGGPATSASLAGPLAVALNSAGDLFISDTDSNRIRKVEAATGIIRTVAGNGTLGNSGDGGAAISAKILPAQSMAVDAKGNLYMTNFFYVSGSESSLYTNFHSVRRVDAVTGIITTVAGLSAAGFSGDGGPATKASLFWPRGIASDASGNIFIADTLNFRIRKINSATGIISTFSGIGDYTLPWEGSRAVASNLPSGFSFQRPMAADDDGNVYMPDDKSCRIWKVDGRTGLVSAIAGNGECLLSINPGAPIPNFDGNATEIRLFKLYDSQMAIGRNGSLYFFNSSETGYVDGSRAVFLLKLDTSSGQLSRIAGNSTGGYSGEGGPAISAGISSGNLSVDSRGNIFISSRFRVRKIDAATGVIRTVAGTGKEGFSGDGGLATDAQFEPRYGAQGGIAVDSKGNLYISDTQNHRIRKVDSATGLISTIAGNGTTCEGDWKTCVSKSGDDGPASKSVVVFPGPMRIDSSDNLYFVDSFWRIRKINLLSGVVTHLGPSVDSRSGYSTGDGGLFKAATLGYSPLPAFDVTPIGSIYVEDRDLTSMIRAIRGPIP